MCWSIFRIKSDILFFCEITPRNYSKKQWLITFKHQIFIMIWCVSSLACIVTIYSHYFIFSVGMCFWSPIVLHDPCPCHSPMVRNLLQDPLNTGARSGTSRVEQWIYCPVHDKFYISKVFVVLQFLLHLKLVLFSSCICITINIWPLVNLGLNLLQTIQNKCTDLSYCTTYTPATDIVENIMKN